MKNLAVLCLLACFAVLCFAENRGTAYTPEQLHKMSTLVFSGTVVRIETDERYQVSFPTRAKVADVEKGQLKEKELSFAHKHPGRSTIFEQEFNTPKVGQEGTFYLQKQGNSLVLIGYIAKTEQTVGGDSVKAADGLH